MDSTAVRHPVTETLSCQHEQGFYQSDEGAGGFEKVHLKQKY